MTTRAWVLCFLVAAAAAAPACKRNAPDLATAKDDSLQGGAPADGADPKLEQAVGIAMQQPQEAAVEPADDFAVDEAEGVDPDDATGTAALALDDTGIPPEAGQDLAGQTTAEPTLTPDEIDTKVLEFLEQDIAAAGSTQLADGTGPSAEGTLRGAVAAAVFVSDILPAWTAQLANLQGAPAGSGTGSASAAATGSGTQVAQGASTSTPAASGAVSPDDAAPAGLGLADDPSGTEKAEAISTLKGKIARGTRQAGTYATKSAVFNAVKSAPDQFQCVANGAILKNGVCQCRGWMMDVAKHSFPVPTTPLKTFLISAADRRCPMMEQRYCNGWETKNGGCGLYKKGDGYGVPAMAFAARDAGDPDTDCFNHYKGLIHDNAKMLFTAPASAQASCVSDPSRTTAYVALKRAAIVELWEFKKTDGSVVGQIDIAKYTQTHNGAGVGTAATATPVPGRRTSGTAVAAPGAVAATLADYRALCVTVTNGVKTATWNWSMSGGGGCDCVGARTAASVYLGNSGISSGFVANCQTALGQ